MLTAFSFGYIRIKAQPKSGLAGRTYSDTLGVMHMTCEICQLKGSGSMPPQEIYSLRLYMRVISVVYHSILLLSDCCVKLTALILGN